MVEYGLRLCNKKKDLVFFYEEENDTIICRCPKEDAILGVPVAIIKKDGEFPLVTRVKEELGSCDGVIGCKSSFFNEDYNYLEFDDNTCLVPVYRTGYALLPKKDGRAFKKGDRLCINEEGNLYALKDRGDVDISQIIGKVYADPQDNPFWYIENGGIVKKFCADDDICVAILFLSINEENE